MLYRRCGRSGLELPAVSLGLWQNFGHDRPLETSRAIVRRAFDLGITHFDLANNYGPPYGSAEENFGRLLREDLRPYRDELVISTRPATTCGRGRTASGARASTCWRASTRASRAWGSTTSTSSTRTASTRRRRSRRRWARSTPPCAQGKALYVGISSYSAEQTREAAAILRELGTPLLIHQPSYSMLNRWIEDGPARRARRARRRLHRLLAARAGDADRQVPRRHPGGLARGAGRARSRRDLLTDEVARQVRALNEIAAARGQTLAQMALAWTLRDPRVTSALDRRVERRAARGERRRARPARLLRRRARGDRPATRSTAASTSGRSRARAHDGPRPARTTCFKRSVLGEEPESARTSRARSRRRRGEGANGSSPDLTSIGVSARYAGAGKRRAAAR